MSKMLQMIKYATYSQLSTLQRFKCHARKKLCRYQKQKIYDPMFAISSIKMSPPISFHLQKVLITKHAMESKSYDPSIMNWLSLLVWAKHKIIYHTPLIKLLLVSISIFKQFTEKEINFDSRQTRTKLCSIGFTRAQLNDHRQQVILSLMGRHSNWWNWCHNKLTPGQGSGRRAGTRIIFLQQAAE